MKILGRKISGANVETLVLPRGDGNDLIFKARAVLDMTDFEKILTPPKPREAMLPGGQKKYLVEEPQYQAAIHDYAAKRVHYLILRSLEATEGLEWETVKMEDPNTWANYGEEMKASGLSNAEQGKIVELVMRANAMSEQHLKEARERFLATEQAVKSLSPTDGLPTTQSGESAKG